MFYINCFVVYSTVQNMLSEGGVSQRPVVFVNRPELLNQVRKKLYLLQKDVGGWVTVFGMAGSGKSVLAAEAVRDHGVIEGEYHLNNLRKHEIELNEKML